MDAHKLRPIALVTGASSGIGEAYAGLLASQGYDVWLVARQAEKLADLGRKLTKDHGCMARVSVCDLADRRQVGVLCEAIALETRLEMLVHNAGFGVHGEIGEADLGKLMGMVEVHVASTIALCAAAAPLLRQRGRGGVVIVSSIASWLWGSGSATYCATKAFETSFARSLAEELRPHGVRVQGLCPGYTRTAFHDTPEYAHWNRHSVPSWFWSTPNEVASHSWKRLGKDVICVPGCLNRLVVTVGRFVNLSRWRQRFRLASR